MQRSSYRRGEFFIGASRARPFSATYTVLLPSSALSPSSSSRHPFHLLSRRHQRQPFDDKFSKRVPHHVVETRVENFGSWCPSQEAQPRPISDSPPTVCMHRENLVFELRYTSWPHPVAANVTKLPMKRRAVTFAISKPYTPRDCYSSTYHVPILTNSTIRSFNATKLL